MSIACRVVDRKSCVTLFCAAVLAVVGVACGDHDDAEREHDAGGSGGDTDSGSAGGKGARLYVTVSGDDEVISIDEATQKVLSHIPVGAGPAIIVSTPDHSQLFTADWEGDSVTAIDVATEDTHIIKVSSRPYVIAMSPKGDFLYAGLNDATLVAIDTKTHDIVRTFDTSVLAASVIVSADGKTLYVASLNTLFPGRLQALDAVTGEVVGPQLVVGAAPAWITITPDGSKVFTLNFLSDDVTVVDTETWKKVSTVSTGAGSQAIIGNVTPDNSRLYVTNHGTGELMGIDTESYEVVQTVKLDGRPVGVNFNTDGSRVYVTDFGPKSLLAGVDTNFLLTGMFSTTDPGQVSAYDVKTGKLIGKKISVGPGATSVVYVPE